MPNTIFVCMCVSVPMLIHPSHVQLLQPHGLQPTRLLSPWDFSGKNTGVGYHLLLQGILQIQGLNSHLLH